jgi:hypothetical protein
MEGERLANTERTAAVEKEQQLWRESAQERLSMLQTQLQQSVSQSEMIDDEVHRLAIEAASTHNPRDHARIESLEAQLQSTEAQLRNTKAELGSTWRQQAVAVGVWRQQQLKQKLIDEQRSYLVVIPCHSLPLCICELALYTGVERLIEWLCE